MQKWYIVLLASLFCYELPGQDRLHIRLLDSRQNTPLGFATIRAEAHGLGAMTDSSGLAVLPFPEGVHRLAVRVRLLGYQTFNGILEPTDAVVELRMEPLSAALGEVVISGTMKPMARSESATPVEVYTPKFFRANPTPNLFDGLNIVNGVQPQLNCNVCATGDIHINGLEGPYTMVLIDGMPVLSALSTVYGLQGIPNSLIERMEVVKGPASTLYGSEAVAGLINVITVDPREAPRFSADLNHSSYGETTLDLSSRLQAKGGAGVVSASLFNFQQRRDANDDGFTDLPLQRRASLFGKWAFDLPDEKRVQVGLRYVYEDRFGGEMDWAPEWYASDSIYGESIRTDRYEMIGKWEMPMVKGLQLAWSWNLHDQRSAYGATPYNGRQQVAFAQLSWDKTLRQRHALLLGLANRYSWLDDDTPVTADPEGLVNRPSVTWLPGLFIQDDIRFTAQHRLLLGLRYDWNSIHGSVLTPRANWKWTPVKGHVFRLSTGTGYRVANVFSEDHAALTGAREVVLARDLRPERSWNVNLNYNTQFFPGFGFIGLDATLFHTYFSNRILADYDTDPDKVLYDNLNGYAISQGFTLNSDWNTTFGLSGMAGFTWMDVFTREQGERRPQVHAPPFSATWSLAYTVQKWRLSVDYTGSLSSPMPLPVVPNDFRPDRSPWFSLQNVQLRWSVPSGRLEFYCSAKNLLDFRPQNPLLRPFDPFDREVDDPVANPHGYTFDTAYNYAPLQGRRVVAGFRYRLQ